MDFGVNCPCCGGGGWLFGAMSFVFRGSRADIEAGGFPGFAPDRRAMVRFLLAHFAKM